MSSDNTTKSTNRLPNQLSAQRTICLTNLTNYLSNELSAQRNLPYELLNAKFQLTANLQDFLSVSSPSQSRCSERQSCTEIYSS